MAFQPWTRHVIVGGRCTRCGTLPPLSAIFDGQAYWLKGVGWLTHVPTGNIVDCEAQ